MKEIRYPNRVLGKYPNENSLNSIIGEDGYNVSRCAGYFPENKDDMVWIIYVYKKVSPRAAVLLDLILVPR